MKRTKLKPISPRQRQKIETWATVTNERLNILKEIFGIPICEWCGRPSFQGHELGSGSGHHLKKRQYNIHTPEVCFIAGWCCHDYLERHPEIEVKQFYFAGAPEALRKKLIEKVERWKYLNDV